MTKDQIEQKIAELHEKLFALQKDIEEVERESVKMNDVEEWPNIGREYWIVTASGEPASSNWDNDSCDNLRIRIGNVFRTEQDAKFAAERLKVLAEMRKFISDKSPIANGKHYIIAWNNYGKQIDIYPVNGVIYTSVCFETYNDAETCIFAIGEERLKKYYFGAKDDE